MTAIFNRRDFEYNINMLTEQSRMGKIHMVETMKDILPSLLDMKKTPNGRVNFNTVDQNARLMANSVAHMFNQNTELAEE